MTLNKVAKISFIAVFVLIIGGCSVPSEVAMTELTEDVGKGQTEIVETSIPTKESTPTISPEQMEREEILERLKTRNLSLTDEEMKEVMPFDDRSIEDLITSMRKYLYHDIPFVYIIFTDNDNVALSQYAPYNFPQTDSVIASDLHGFDKKEISYFLTAVTSKHIIEGWDGNVDIIVFMNKDENDNTCFWPKQACGDGYILNQDGSYKHIDFNDPSDTKFLTNEEVKAFDGYLIVRKNKDGSLTSLCNYEDDLASGFEGHTTPTPDVTPTVAE